MVYISTLGFGIRFDNNMFQCSQMLDLIVTIDLIKNFSNANQRRASVLEVTSCGISEAGPRFVRSSLFEIASCASALIDLS